MPSCFKPAYPNWVKSSRKPYISRLRPTVAASQGFQKQGGNDGHKQFFPLWMETLTLRETFYFPCRKKTYGGDQEHCDYKASVWQDLLTTTKAKQFIRIGSCLNLIYSIYAKLIMVAIVYCFGGIAVVCNGPFHFHSSISINGFGIFHFKVRLWYQMDLYLKLFCWRDFRVSHHALPGCWLGYPYTFVNGISIYICKLVSYFRPCNS